MFYFLFLFLGKLSGAVMSVVHKPQPSLTDANVAKHTF